MKDENMTQLTAEEKRLLENFRGLSRKGMAEIIGYTEFILSREKLNRRKEFNIIQGRRSK